MCQRLFALYLISVYFYQPIWDKQKWPNAAFQPRTRGAATLTYKKRHRFLFRALCEVACKRIVRNASAYC